MLTVEVSIAIMALEPYGVDVPTQIDVALAILPNVSTLNLVTLLINLVRVPLHVRAPVLAWLRF